MRRLRVAVIGAGRLGSIHARLAAALPDVELVAVVDPSPAARAAVTRELGVPSLAHYSEIREPLDAAVVAAPTAMHYELCRELLQRDLHVLVEKPMTSTTAQAQSLVALANQRRRVLQVGHVERFNPAFVAAQRYCQEPCYIEAARTSSFTCRSVDIGVVFDLMIHDLDLVLSLVDSPLVSVQAAGTPVIGPHEDMAQARLTFASGCVANLTASRTSYVPQRTMQIYHRSGFVGMNLAEKTAVHIQPAAAVRQGLDVAHLSDLEREQMRTRLFEDFLPLVALPVEDTNAIGDELREFVACIQTGAVPRVSGEAGCQAVEVAEWVQEEIAAYQARLHRPATLPLPQRSDNSVWPRRQAG